VVSSYVGCCHDDAGWMVLQRHSCQTMQKAQKHKIWCSGDDIVQKNTQGGVTTTSGHHPPSSSSLSLSLSLDDKEGGLHYYYYRSQRARRRRSNLSKFGWRPIKKEDSERWSWVLTTLSSTTYILYYTWPQSKEGGGVLQKIKTGCVVVFLHVACLPACLPLNIIDDLLVVP
jgi:hypothetical protein